MLPDTTPFPLLLVALLSGGEAFLLALARRLDRRSEMARLPPGRPPGLHRT